MYRDRNQCSTVNEGVPGAVTEGHMRRSVLEHAIYVYVVEVERSLSGSGTV